MSEVKEFILCAAIDYNGIIISSHRHGDCYEVLEALVGKIETSKLLMSLNSLKIKVFEEFFFNKKKEEKEKWEIDLRDNIDILIDKYYKEPNRNHFGVVTGIYLSKKEIKEKVEECINYLLSGKDVKYGSSQENFYIVLNVVEQECNRLGMNIKIHDEYNFIERIIN